VVIAIAVTKRGQAAGTAGGWLFRGLGSQLVSKQTLAQIDRSAIGNGRSKGAVDRVDAAGAAAFILPLPRSFKVLVVRRRRAPLADRHWAFRRISNADEPVVRAALPWSGLESAARRANPDLLVLSLPLSQGKNSLASRLFGGFPLHIDGDLSRHWRCRLM